VEAVWLALVVGVPEVEVEVMAAGVVAEVVALLPPSPCRFRQIQSRKPSHSVRLLSLYLRKDQQSQKRPTFSETKEKKTGQLQ